MRRDALFILALSVFSLGIAGGQVSLAANYCPPGAKFCPAPDSDSPVAPNTVALDTHFGIDAKTGERTVYTGSVHPDEIFDEYDTQEKVLLVMPTFSVENRYVPPSTYAAQQPVVAPSPVVPQPAQAAKRAQPAARQAAQPARQQAAARQTSRQGSYQQPAGRPVAQPQQRQGVSVAAYQPKAQPRQAQPVPQTQVTTVYPVPHPQPQPVVVYSQPNNHYHTYPNVAQQQVIRPGATSEVANQQTSRVQEKKPATEGDKVPWWKGGLWRGKKGDDGNKKGKTSGSGAKAGGGGGPKALSAADDMWDDDEFSDYGTEGGGNSDYSTFTAAAPDFGHSTSVASSYPQPVPVGDPYSQYDQTTTYQTTTYQSGSMPTMVGGHTITTSVNSSDPFAIYGTTDPQAMSSSSSTQFPQTSTYSTTTTTTYSGGYGGGSAYGSTSYGSTEGTASLVTGGGYDSGMPGMPPAAPLGADPFGGGYGATSVTTTTTSYGGDESFLPAPPLEARSSVPPPPPVDRTPAARASGPGSSAAAVTGSPQFENAVKLVKDNRFSEAKAILQRETASTPNNAAVWRWLADCHYNLLELEDAIQCYQRAREIDPNDYYTARGQGFAYLHRGHELWRQMQEEVARGQKTRAADIFSQAHENYKKALDLIGSCLRKAPNDSEAIFGEAMAAEGASRKLYSNAISYLKLGPDNRERAELFAENCLTVINKGIERARDRAKQSPGEVGPRALLGGLYLRKALLYNQLGKNDLALIELKNAHDIQQSILDEIDKNNASAIKGMKECEAYWAAWGGNKG